METIGLVIMGIGWLALVVGGLWMLIETFKTGILWGIGCLVFGPIALIWLVTHWEDGKHPFLLNLGGFGLVLLGGYLGG